MQMYSFLIYALPLARSFCCCIVVQLSYLDFIKIIPMSVAIWVIRPLMASPKGFGLALLNPGILVAALPAGSDSAGVLIWPLL